MAAYFVDDPLDLIDHWSVLGLLKYMTQPSYWSKGWPNAKFPENAVRAIRRSLYVWKDREPQWPLLRLSEFGHAVKRSRSSVLSTGREGRRVAVFTTSSLCCAWLEETKSSYLLVWVGFLLLSNPYGPESSLNTVIWESTRDIFESGM